MLNPTRRAKRTPQVRLMSFNCLRNIALFAPKTKNYLQCHANHWDPDSDPLICLFAKRDNAPNSLFETHFQDIFFVSKIENEKEGFARIFLQELFFLINVLHNKNSSCAIRYVYPRHESCRYVGICEPRAFSINYHLICMTLKCESVVSTCLRLWSGRM